MTTAKTTSRQQRGITLFRERGQEIVKVEPGVYCVPASEGGGFYRVDFNRQTCECKDRAPACKHLFAATIFAAKKRCRRATTERLGTTTRLVPRNGAGTPHAPPARSIPIFTLKCGSSEIFCGNSSRQ